MWHVLGEKDRLVASSETSLPYLGISHRASPPQQVLVAASYALRTELSPTTLRLLVIAMQGEVNVSGPR